MTGATGISLVGEDIEVPCVDGVARRYLSLDAAASTAALPAVAARVEAFLPWYSSVHRGAGWKSQQATTEYEEARAAMIAFAGRTGTDDVAIICRNTTEAINHLAYRLGLGSDDVVVTTVVEHHANLLPWARLATRRYVECGAVDLVDLDEVVWTDPPEREEAGSPNVLGAVALHAAIDELGRIGWDAVRSHDDAMAAQLREGLRGIEGVRLLGTGAAPGGLPVASFEVEGVPHALVAARLSAEHAIGVRHGCFCAHPYLLRLLGLTPAEVEDYRHAVLRGDRRRIPGAVRASASLSTTQADIDRFVDAVRGIAAGDEPPVPYDQDEHTGDYWPHTDEAGWSEASRRIGASCARG